MIYENIELHNIDDMVEEEGRDGLRLQRVPESLREKINPGAQQRSLWMFGSEIRFAFTGESATVTLSSNAETDCTIFQGPFRVDHVTITEGPVPIVLRPAERVGMLAEEHRGRLEFSTDVFRLQFGGRRKGHIYFHGVEGEGIRPPAKEELPSLRYLAYGTSITQGIQATYASLSYVAQAAWRLGADVINLGMGGSCFCEPEFADYIAGRDDWDVATLALSVNMVAGFSPEEFRDRVDYMVNTVAASNPKRPVICITLYPYIKDLCTDEDEQNLAEVFRYKLRQVVAASPCRNLHLIEGTDILTDIGGLTADLVHPADNGMINMGENLAARMKTILARAT